MRTSLLSSPAFFLSCAASFSPPKNKYLLSKIARVHIILLPDETEYTISKPERTWQENIV